MKSWCKNLLAAGLSIAFLSACSSTDDEEIIKPLPEITETVSPSIDWSTSVGDGVGDFYSRLQPTVNYGKIFAGSRNGELVAFDEKTHDKLWSQDLETVIKDAGINKQFRMASGITVARNKVFVGGEAGVLVALNANDGKVVWYAETDGELLSKPTVGEDAVVVNTGNGMVEAYNVDDGKKLWTHSNALPPLTLRGNSSPAFEGGGFFVGTADGKVQVIVQQNGQVAWEVPISKPQGGNEFSRLADVDMTPLISGENIYAINYHGNLVSLEPRSGRVVWSRKYSSFHELARAGLSLFVVDDSSRIYSIDKRNGLEQWSNSELSTRSLTSPAVFGQYIVVGDFEGYLHFINRSTGVIEGRVQIDSSGLYVQPVVVGDKLLVQTRSGKLAEVVLP
ncbi:outer membrane protein assembly factor BamB [Shewanella sp. 202IG2-18]|uniref:outer membrane protein assembly factor BamB n=1 Tax=Parashewanella hymeniacidonis TaxID=2807618 RepID=UPI0019620066|nr:outer membrane protein assembly factor BamB [Parashewanella hymeniacidonis]MBM7073719.1 outer membrane protein assembly factor BamB [Parashewanella hymeniacidonis]